MMARRAFSGLSHKPRSTRTWSKRLTVGIWAAGLWSVRLVTGAFGIGASLAFPEAVQKDRIISHGLLDQLFEQEKLGAVDNGVNTMLKSLHGGECLERFTEEQHGGMPPLSHGHGLERLQRQVLPDVVCGK